MSGLAFFSGDGARRRAEEWRDDRRRAVVLDWNDFGRDVDRVAAAAACASAARSLYAAGVDVAVCGEDYDLHWRHRLGPLMEESPRTLRRIESPSVALRAWAPGDVPWVVEACQDADIARWTNIPWPYEERDARSLIELSDRSRRMRSAALFAILDIDGGADTLAGSAALTFGPDAAAEVGYWMAASARGRGLATAAVKLLATWGFQELGLARIELTTMVGNTASERVAARAGFEREGVLRAAQSGRDGGRVDLVSWSRTAPPAPAPAPAQGDTTPPGSA